MRHFIFLIAFALTFTVNISVKGASNDQERSIMNCARVLSRVLIYEDAGLQSNVDPTPYVDTLYQYLYTQPVKVKINYECIGKLPLQAYFLTHEDKRVDYDDIEKCIMTTHKAKSFQTLPSQICALGFAIRADSLKLPEKVFAMSTYALTINDKLSPNDSISPRKRLGATLAACSAFDMKLWSQAAKYYSIVVDMDEKTSGRDSESYKTGLSTQAFCLARAGEYSQSDSCYCILQKHLKEKGIEDRSEYADILLSRIDNQSNLQHYSDCEALLRELMLISNKDDDWYMEALSDGLDLYTEEYDYDTALNYLQEAVSYLKQGKAVAYDDFATCISYGKIPNSGKELKEIVSMLESTKDKTDVASLATLAYAYSAVGRLQESYDLAKQAESLFNKMNAEEQSAVWMYMDKVYTVLNDFDKQIDYLEREISMTEQSVGKNDPLVYGLKNTESTLYFLKGDSYKAEALLDSCINSGVFSDGELYDMILDLYGIYIARGEYAAVIKVAKNMLERVKDPVQKYKVYSTISSSLMAELDISTNDVTDRTVEGLDELKEELLEYSLATYEFSKQNFGEGHFNSIQSLYLLAAAEYFNGDLSKMIQYADLAVQLIEKNFKNESIRKENLSGFAGFYIYGKDYDKDLSLLDMSCLTNEYAMRQEKEPTLEMLAEIYQRKGDLPQAQTYYRQLADLLTEVTSGQMISLTSKERQTFWRQYRQTLNNAGKYIDKPGEQTDFAGTVYNLALYSKSLLLNSDLSFTRAVEATGNEALKEKMKQLVMANNLLLNGDLTDKEQYANAKTQADALEKELLASVKGLQQNSAYQTAHWQDIQRCLSDNTIAVELIEYITSDDKAHYGASILRKGWQYPVFVEIGDKKTVEKSLSNLFFDDSAARAAWNYILPYAQEGDTICISLAGMFHKMPIESFSLDGTKTMGERFTIQRLTSTAELLHTDYAAGHGASVFGGMKYGKSLEELNGSKEEVMSIAQALRQQSAFSDNVTPYLGEKASGESFRNLSGQKQDIIHVSTHGYYHSQEDEVTGSLLSAYRSMPTEDTALKNCGLYFSGEEKLTARDIADLDFRGLDMVSLSACQTGLGDVSADGVFGLQRGFKKAGTHSILMTLWSVANEPTKAFMSSFYSNLYSGKARNKAEALEMAKQAVKSNPAWQSPDYWAAFVLLDGIK